MGFNTTVVVMNDELEEIANDKHFGRNLVAAIKANQLMMDLHGHFSPQAHIHVSTGPGSNRTATVAKVIEQHHADIDTCLIVGNDTAFHLGYYDGPETKQDMLKALATSLGYSLRKKPTKKNTSS